MAHPEIPTCSDCQRWLYDAEWRPVMARPRGAGKRERRPASSPTPCWKCPKSEDQCSPNPGADLTDTSMRMLEHYYRLKAGLAMPDDPLVVWYSSQIRWVEDCVARNTQMMPVALLAAMVGGAGGKRRV